MTDFLQRVNLKSLYNDTEWLSLVVQSKYNITNNRDIVNKYFHITEGMSDNDMVVINRLVGKILSREKITDLYWADDWQFLADNLILINQTINNKTSEKHIIIRDLYNSDDHWNKSVLTAKNIMSKLPPPQFVEKWNLLGDEKFRERMRSSDENAVITMNLAMALSKGQKINLYHTDDWELLQEMLKYS